MSKLILFCLMLAVVSADLFAGPRVIRDNRLKDLAITPALGRGYSMSTNTYQSLCMSNVAVTKPSYNFKYKFLEIEKDWESNFEVTREGKMNMRYLFLKANANFKTEVEGSNTYHLHHILAHIYVNSYYNSVDEGKTKLSESAKSLLTKGDVVGFFDSCGPYYVRSIGRHSSYLALLSYRTKSASRDVSFDLKLKARMKAFFVRGNASVHTTGSFHSEMSEKRLSIMTWAYGLGKEHLGDLIPTDIDSFKKSIQDAMKAMQDADTGIIDHIEVVPWVENTEFQNNLKLENENDILKYEEKINLESNAELLAEIDRISRAQMEVFHKAKVCRRVLDEEYLLLTGNYAYNPDHTWFQDIRSPKRISKYVTLKYLDQILSKSNVEKYYTENRKFLYGETTNGDTTPKGAIGCRREIFRQGPRKVSYRDIPACVNAQKWAVPLAPVLDHYCMPDLGRITTPE